MSEQQQQDPLLDHEYDGIREYDNPLPAWWTTLFWITIVFAVIYFVFYGFGPGKTVVEAYNQEMVAYYDLQAQQLLALGPIKESTLLKLMDDESMIAGGAQIFQSKCAQCHAANAGGNIGPNLTDDYWLHGGKLTDIYHTITEGVPSKGMLAWKNQLSPAEILSVAAYVGSLRGSNPSPAKAPQGKLFVYDPDKILAEEAAADAPAEENDDGAGKQEKTEAATSG